MSRPESYTDTSALAAKKVVTQQAPATPNQKEMGQPGTTTTTTTTQQVSPSDNLNPNLTPQNQPQAPPPVITNPKIPLNTLADLARQVPSGYTISTITQQGNLYTASLAPVAKNQPHRNQTFNVKSYSSLRQ